MPDRIPRGDVNQFAVSCCQHFSVRREKAEVAFWNVRAQLPRRNVPQSDDVILACDREGRLIGRNGKHVAADMQADRSHARRAVGT